MPEIKFSHNYDKLHNQTSAQLLKVIECDRSKLSAAFVEYDTVYHFPKPNFPQVEDAGNFSLPDGRLLVLVFIGNDLFPFTTVRRWTVENFCKYVNSIGDTFEIKIATEIPNKAFNSDQGVLGKCEVVAECPNCKKTVMVSFNKNAVIPLAN